MFINNDFTDNMNDNTQVEAFSDSNFLNYVEDDNNFSYHINWFTGKGHNEAHRAAEKKDDVVSKCGSGFSSMNCSQLEDAYWCLDEQLIAAEKSSTSSRGARRVRDRAIAAIKPQLSSVESYQDSRDCEGGTSGLDTALDDNVEYEKQLEEYDAQKKIDELKYQSDMSKQEYEMQQMMMMQKEQADKDKKMLMYGGVGIISILLIGLVMKSN
jgi:hypothetical protein